MPCFSDLSSAINRACERQPQAIQELYDAYVDLLFRYCYVRLNDREAAEDCVQEVFICVWKGINTFEYRNDISLTAWIYTIANNVVVSYVRKRDRMRASPLTSELRSTDTRSFDVASTVCDRLAIRQALSQLTSEQQHVIALKFFVGLSNHEIAEIIHRSEGAVKALQYRAINRLYHLLVPEQTNTQVELELAASA
jgi:RNA polymerase sigma-70 factor (ECF subfamily)